MKEKRKCFKCGVSPSGDPSITLHRFPKPGRTNSLRCELWAKYCFPHGLWHSLEFQTKLYSEHRMLCNMHFKKTSFIDIAHTRLLKSAAPDEECDKMLTSPVQGLAGSSTILETIAGTSTMPQPIMENVNLINTNQAKARLFTRVPVPLQ